MKRIRKISLHSLAQSELKERQKKDLRGGYILDPVCVTNCRCEYISTNDPDDPLRGLTNTDNNRINQSSEMTYL